MMTFKAGLRKFRLVPSLVLAGVIITACATAPVRPPAPISTGQPRPDPVPQPTPTPEPTPELPPIVEPTPQIPVEEPTDYITPEHMEGRNIKRIAVLLPFNHPTSSGVREQASSILAAVEMAMFDQYDDGVLLLPKDTAGDARKAAAMTQEAIDEGADVIIGPLLSNSVQASAEIASANDIPVIAFSNDQAAAGLGAYLLSFPAEEEVSRIVDWSVQNGITRFAFIGPSNTYARRVETALRFEAARRGSSVIISAFYDPSNQAPVDQARAVAERINLMRRQGGGKIGIVIPDRGVGLLAVAPLIPYYGVNLKDVQYIGTSIWDDSSIWREPVLANGVYAAPPAEDLGAFNRDFRDNYSRDPASLAILGYDAAALAISFLGDGAVTDDELLDQDGFRGVSGLFRFRPDGRIERGLSVLSITPQGPKLEEEAPSEFFTGVN